MCMPLAPMMDPLSLKPLSTSCRGKGTHARSHLFEQRQGQRVREQQRRRYQPPGWGSVSASLPVPVGEHHSQRGGKLGRRVAEAERGQLHLYD